MDAKKYETNNNYINAKKFEENKILQNPLEIIGVVEEQVNERENPKLMLCFGGVKDTLVLNKTNLKTMIKAKGAETENWIGATISLSAIPAQFEGKPTTSVIISKVV